jgi:hypothetical protein
MQKKLIYVTKKQIVSFVETEMAYRNIDENQLMELVSDALIDLKEDDGHLYNRNQIKFLTRVYEYLNNL